MKLNLATLMALMVAVARTAPVPGDNTLVDAEILNDSVKNVGNNALSGLVDELSGLLGQLTDALGGLLKRGVDTETTDNALIKAGVANDAVKDVLNNAAKRDEAIDDNAVKDVLDDLAKRGDNTEAKNNTLIKLSILNNALDRKSVV